MHTFCRLLRDYNDAHKNLPHRIHMQVSTVIKRWKRWEEINPCFDEEVKLVLFESCGRVREYIAYRVMNHLAKLNYVEHRLRHIALPPAHRQLWELTLDTAATLGIMSTAPKSPHQSAKPPESPESAEPIVSEPAPVLKQEEWRVSVRGWARWAWGWVWGWAWAWAWAMCAWAGGCTI